ncbi:unnamed protein product [Caenorhabditis bovis]|uniref:glucuronosyltransferase n=1 Tax=Caenorhabditis bovis TaxID=2654633 RepID=A0A8S1E8D3_9PELO|nr:unnamed protein product [Caenorhabditis bovis]
MLNVANSIADGGHNVTILRPYHSGFSIPKDINKKPNIEILDYIPDHYEPVHPMFEHVSKGLWYEKPTLFSMPSTAFSFSSLVTSSLATTNRYVLTDKELHIKLKSRNFDAFVVEIFDLSGFYLNEILEIPAIIGVFSAVRQGPTEQMFGGVNVLFKDWYAFFWNSVLFGRLFEQQHENYAHLVNTSKTMTEIVTKSSFFMVNANPYLDFPIPTPPSIVQIGGFTMSKYNAEKLSSEYEKILSEHDSAVFISFGSMTKSSQMPEHYKAGIIQMFKLLPEITFIWKYEKDDSEFIKQLPNNVHLKTWVPIFAEQPHNAKMLSQHGGAEIYEKEELSDGKKLANVIEHIVNNPRYQKNAEQLRDILKHQPIDPKTVLLSHVEFAARFPNMKSSLVPSLINRDLVSYYCLDLVLFLASLALFVFFAIAKSISWLYRKFRSSIKDKTA